MFIASDRGADRVEVPDAAFRAAPAEVAAGGEILPRQPTRGPCRLCGNLAALSREHVPPASAGNAGRSVVRGIEDWLARASLDEAPGGRPQQGGVWGRTLCEPCNNATGRYASEYRGWAARAVRLLGEIDSSDVLDSQPVSKLLRVQFDEVRPGAFVRQVLSLMASMSGPWDIARRHPELRGMVLEGTTGELPAGMSLDMSLFYGPSCILAGPTLVIDRASNGWKWCVVVAFPPFAFEMVLAADWQEGTPMCGIGDFLAVPPGSKASVELDLFVAFGHTALPTDWRTRHQIENRLDVYGNPE